MEEPKNPDGIRELADESENGGGGEGRPGPQDYRVAADAAIGFMDLGMHEEAIAALRRWPVEKVPLGIQVLLRSLLREKRYHEAVEEGLRLRAKGGSFSSMELFDFAVALNACGRHEEAREAWLEALALENCPVLHIGLACELAQLGDPAGALSEYCAGVRSGFKAGLYDLADPDLTPMWSHAAAGEFSREAAELLSGPVWDGLTGPAPRFLPNQGHATIRELREAEREMMEWNALSGGFEITAAARRRDPALAQSVERTLWERFNKNADNLRRAVKQAGKTQQRISL